MLSSSSSLAFPVTAQPQSTNLLVDQSGRPLAPLAARQGSLSLFSEGSSALWTAEPDLSGFKDYQVQTALDLFEWLKAGPGNYTATGIRENAVRTLCGVAGAGKSFMTKSLLTQFKRCCPGLFVEGPSQAKILGCAPNNQQVKVLRNQNAPFDNVSTIASLFGIKPDLIKLTAKERLQLLELESKYFDSLDEGAKFQLYCLRKIQDLEAAGEVVFQAKGDPSKSLKNVRLLIVDECGNVDQQLATIFNSALADRSESLRPDFQLLFVGDPEQLPPQKEILSVTFGFKKVTPLTEVSRFAGLLLDLSVQLRTPGTDLKRVMDDYIARSMRMPESELPTINGCSYRPIEACRELEGYERMAGLLQSGETARWIAPTHAAVNRINAGVQKALKGTDVLDYRNGDKLLTLEPVMRGPNGECRFKKSGAEMKCGNSELLTVRSSRLLCERPDGLRLFDVAVEHDEVGYFQLILLDPNQVAKLPLMLGESATRAKAWQHEPKHKIGSSRATKQDQAVFALWQELGISSWASVSSHERNRSRSREWARYHELKSCCDDVSYAAASTVHKAQGSQYENVFVSLSDLFGGRMAPDYGRGTDWDIAKMLYTIATRVEVQFTCTFA